MKTGLNDSNSSTEPSCPQGEIIILASSAIFKDIRLWNHLASHNQILCEASLWAMNDRLSLYK